MIACRECHREGQHNLSCSHVRYDGELAVVPADEVAPSHEPPQPYCPGAAVSCYFGRLEVEDGEPPACSKTGGDCYYGAAC